jgi:hypothetical protein
MSYEVVGEGLHPCKECGHIHLMLFKTHLEDRLMFEYVGNQTVKCYWPECKCQMYVTDRFTQTINMEV